MNKQLASLSVDLDNLWAYLKTHGDPGWSEFPSYLDLVAPRILEMFDALEVKSTIFVVGQDAILPQNHSAIRRFAEAGHEIGNHSFRHEPWLHLYSDEELDTEFRRTEEAIINTAGQAPVGFRGPGFSCSPSVLRILAQRGYRYDASSLPSFLGPVARAYYFFKSSLNRQQKEQRKELFGGFAQGFRSNRPYLWQFDGRELLEIPVTTMPIFKVPIHVSYVLYLASYSRAVARTYFRSAIRLCRMTGTAPSLLVHPPDFMDVTDVPQLAFFPAMKLATKHKLELVEYCISVIQEAFDVVPLQVQARYCVEQGLRKHGLPVSIKPAES